MNTPGLVRGGVALFILGLAGVGCATPTSFEGEAKFPGGARGCYERCAAEQMEMASFVYVGEYSTACACQPRRASAATSAGERSSPAMVAAAAGAELERRRRVAAQQASMSGAGVTPFMGH